ncbi:MAG: cupredoxin domain-containing protein [Solirubrobacteraceae bacterium]
MRTHRRLLLAAIGLGLAAVAALPAMAGSETGPEIKAVNGPGPPSPTATHEWSPPQLTVAEGTSVTVSNLTTTPHGIHWVSTPATPVCDASVPVGTGESASGTQWTGKCTFARAGTYSFYCTVHGPAMSGTVTVSAASGPPPVSPPSTGGGSNGQPQSGAGAPGTTTTPGSAGAGTLASPFLGGAAKALTLSARQRGSSVRGAVRVSQAGAKGRLDVSLLARSASLARAGQAKQVTVGRFSRSSLRAGTVRFTVALTPRGRRTLKRRGKLALTVRIVLSPASGAPSAATRSVVLHS